MKKKEIRAVIGANYGDEGKGLAARYFTLEAKRRGRSCCNVLFNGGPQRGHTVDLKDGRRHVFHHFGSGTLDGAETVLMGFFVDPIKYCAEARDLFLQFQVIPKCRISFLCPVITPYDVFLNQIIEEWRGEKRHGSCGCGIWETACRYRDSEYCWETIRSMVWQSDLQIKAFLRRVAEEYVPYRLAQEGVGEVPEEYRRALKSEGLRDVFVRDFRNMMHHSRELTMKFPEDFDTIVFEAGQGLELDEGNAENAPHVTASRTGSYLPTDISCYLFGPSEADYEISYVTRPYFTRHGAGPLPTECEMGEIGNVVPDETNVRNRFQGTLRYGRMDAGKMMERIGRDFQEAKDRMEARASLFLTHLNEAEMGKVPGEALFSAVYRSRTKYAEDVRMEEQEGLWKNSM